jgi:hypothetical protein
MIFNLTYLIMELIDSLVGDRQLDTVKFRDGTKG